MSFLNTLTKSHRIQLASLVWLVYFISLLGAYLIFGVNLIALTVLPLIVSAWLLGRWIGLLLGLATYPVNVLILIALRYPDLAELTGHQFYAPVIGAALFGGVLGWLSESQQALAASARHNRALLQAASEGIHILDGNGYLLDFNDAFMNMLGYTREELRHQNVADWDVRWSRGELRHKLNQLWSSPDIFETVHRRKDGQLIQVEISAVNVTLRDQDYLYCASRNITERKMIENSLRESEERFRSLFSKHAAIMLLIDPGMGAIINANLSAEKFYGYPVAELCRMNISDLNVLPPEQVANERQKAIHELHNIFVFPHRLATGEIRTVEVHSSPIELASQQVLFSIIHDITERELAKQEIQTQRDFAISVMNAMGQGLTVTDENARFEFINPAYARMTGRQPADLIGKTPSNVTYPEDLPGLEQARADRKAGKTTSYESRLIRADGSLMDALITAVPRLKDGSFAGAIAVITDLTERKQAERALQESETLLRKMISNSADGIVLTDEDGRIVEFNAAIEEMTGFMSQAVLGMSLWDFQQSLHEKTHPTLDTQIFKEMMQLALSTGSAPYLYTNLEAPFQPKDGSQHFVQQRIFAIPGNRGWRLGSISRDITSQKLAENELRRAKDALMVANQELVQAIAREQVFARTDGLTGIYNRRYFFELATGQLQSALRYHYPISAIMFDIDHFKQVNDTYGHQIGDQMLEGVAQLAQKQLRGVDILGRYGGEEFVILLPHTHISQAHTVAERIRKAIAAHRLPLDHKKIQVTISVGVSGFHPSDDTLDKLFQRADRAMYQAKESGRNRVAIEDALPTLITHKTRA